MSSREFKPNIYYLIRRGWFEQLSSYCDQIISKKGKDPFTVYWKAFALGMSGNVADCLRLLESFHSRRDMQYAVSLALIFFHRRSSSVDREAVENLTAELSIAEDVTKEAGMILAARFSLFTGDPREASRIAEKFLTVRGSSPSTAFEAEARCIDYWCALARMEERLQDDPSSGLMPEQMRQLQAMDDQFRSLSQTEGTLDIDSLMLWARSRQIISMRADVLNILNQVVAAYPWFVAALADKTMLLATAGEWEQALDTAQRLLDVDKDHLDALEVIAVHAFTQESQQHDALQKFEDLDASIQRRESSSVGYTLEVVTLFSQICSRQPRALQICSRMLERAQRVLSSVNDGGGSDDLMAARLFCLLGTVQTMQGPGNYEKAMKSFREATRKDPDSIAALQGMIYCQLCEGSYDDAESQLELMMLMHGEDGNNALGYEFSYLQAMLWRGKKDMKSHLDSLDKCKDAFLSTVADESISNCASSAVYGPARGTTKLYMDCFANLMTLRPDFVMLTAIDYLEHMENAGNSTSSVIPSTSSLLNGAGGNLKSQLAAQNEANNQQSFGTAAVENDFETNNSNLLSGSGTALEISPAVQSGMDLLNRILRTCPGMVSAYVELSRCYSSLGMFEEASRVLQQCLALQPNCSPVLVAMAKVEVSRMNTAAADRVLEQALACDFSIRSASLFRLVKVLVRAQQGRIDEAITEIELIMNSSDFNFSLNLGGVSDAEIAAASANLSSGLMYGSVNYADSMRLTEDDRVSAYVVYASLLGRARRMKEANKVLSHAKVLFAGSKQEVSILVAASQLSVEKNDFDTAIRMLDKISEDSPTYARAQLIKADILLVHNHDKEGFTKCYAQLTKKDPTSKNYALLGEAYLRILNPEAAIDALENAYRLDPSNGRLRGRIGRALVATHEYHRAVEFYETAIRELAKTGDIDTKDSSKKRREGRESFTSSPKNASTKSSQDMIQLSHDLAKLYIKLGRAESAIRVLQNVLHPDATDAVSLRQNVTTLLLLVKVQQNSSPNEVISTLLHAFKAQKELLIKVRSGVASVSSTNETLESEKGILSDVCVKLGKAYLDMGDRVNAEGRYHEAVQHNPQNTSAIFGLAKLYYTSGDTSQCAAQCRKVLSADPAHSEDAVILLSEVLFQSEDPDSAIEPLQRVLKLRPNNYRVLEKTIMQLRRCGRLEEAAALLASAEKADRRCQSHAGYHYCQGLYAQFTNDVGKAIGEFNLARKDDEWGVPALTRMISLYLNPDSEGAWEEKEVTGPLDESTRANIAAAEELIQELKPRTTDQLRYKVLENYCNLATRNKVNVDRAMQSFIEILEGDQDYLPAVLGMATGFMIEKNQHKARNLLKRVGKMEVSQHDGEDFEKANLLLAKFYIDKGKNDLAQELCKKTLVQNKSCSQAWEILGLVMEKDSNYDLAADCYEKAWKLEFEASASVGFKLAFSYLKCKQYVQAVDICEKVLTQYPDYPRISEEILKKAQQSFRSESQ